jgi:DNA-binding transcriptional regulator YiaG
MRKDETSPQGNPPAPLTPGELRDYRSTNSLSQRALAHLLGVTEDTVYNWERGTHRPPLMTRLALLHLKRRASLRGTYRRRTARVRLQAQSRAQRLLRDKFV